MFCRGVLRDVLVVFCRGVLSGVLSGILYLIFVCSVMIQKKVDFQCTFI